MKTVQLAIRDSDYAQALRNLLLRDGSHRVYLVDRPDLELDGVVVIDENRFQNLALFDSEPERFVVITRKGTDHLSRVWDAGIRHVVFEEDSANTAQLAIIAAELRMPRVASRSGRPVESHAEKHRATALPSLPVLGSPSRCGLPSHCGSPSRCRTCGLKNASNGF
jgi:hypothetical protein